MVFTGMEKRAANGYLMWKLRHHRYLPISHPRQISITLRPALPAALPTPVIRRSWQKCDIV